MFVCIALSDLLPEVQFHAHDRVPLSLSLLVGLLLAWCIGFFEPEHSHNHNAQPEPPAKTVTCTGTITPTVIRARFKSLL